MISFFVVIYIVNEMSGINKEGVKSCGHFNEANKIVQFVRPNSHHLRFTSSLILATFYTILFPNSNQDCSLVT